MRGDEKLMEAMNPSSTPEMKWVACGICRKDIPLAFGGFALPMWDGVVDWNLRAASPVCNDCFVEAMGLTPGGVAVIEDDGYPD